MSSQIRKLTKAGANFWNVWANIEVKAGQFVEYNKNNAFDSSCNGENWCMVGNQSNLEEKYFEPLLEENIQEQ
jgi:hypothetical protein